ncbi:ADP-ribosylation factor 1-like protein [Aphelenchoides bicaudatus]|nr:ADP-ribosylation factor 1-like protein [Aphelenchoides bicaudatus]
MGQTFSAIKALFWGQDPLKILMFGLDFVGKTTILYQLKLGEVFTTIPTIGVNFETVKCKNISFTVWDVAAWNNYSRVWRYYLTGTKVAGLIFVVDSGDSSRLEEAREELVKILGEDELDGVPLLFFANKQDLPNAMNTSDISDTLKLNTLRNRNWHIQPMSVISGQGLYEGLEWLATQVRNHQT